MDEGASSAFSLRRPTVTCTGSKFAPETRAIFSTYVSPSVRNNSNSCASYPIKLARKMCEPETRTILNFPSASVEVPIAVPIASTFAPINGFSVSESVIMPITVADCPSTVVLRKQKRIPVHSV